MMVVVVVVVEVAAAAAAAASQHLSLVQAKVAEEEVAVQTSSA